jgi:hypothetical protein
MVWQAGTQLKGGYIIEKQIGDGGFGLTYLGYKSDHLGAWEKIRYQSSRENGYIPFG